MKILRKVFGPRTSSSPNQDSPPSAWGQAFQLVFTLFEKSPVGSILYILLAAIGVTLFIIDAFVTRTLSQDNLDELIAMVTVVIGVLSPGKASIPTKAAHLPLLSGVGYVGFSLLSLTTPLWASSAIVAIAGTALILAMRSILKRF